MTASLRFECYLNVDLDEMVLNLVPMKQFPFLMGSFSPLSPFDS
jgi:hypothetical protein